MWQGSRPLASTVQAPSRGTAAAEGLGDAVKRREDLPLSLRCFPLSEKIPRAVVLQVWVWVRSSSITWELIGNANSQAPAQTPVSDTLGRSPAMRSHSLQGFLHTYLSEGHWLLWYPTLHPASVRAPASSISVINLALVTTRFKMNCVDAS